ncbi:MAG: hypothetical protein LIO69_08005 [Oscillospiraceae bacterium]|nr:hypothetical protein [Oscillospiraceae bacterium]
MVRIKSKILSLLLASAMSLSVMPGVTAFAAETRGDTSVTYSDDMDYGDLTEKEMACAEEILNALVNYKSTYTPQGVVSSNYPEIIIDVSSYNLRYERWNKVRSMISYTHPELFHINMKTVGIRYNEDNEDIVRTVAFTYVIDKDDYSDAKERFDDAVDTLVDSVPDGLTKAEIALYVHDYIITRCVYNDSDIQHTYSATYRTVEGLKKYEHKYYDGTDGTAYGALVDGEATCAGYSLAYMYVMEKLGIDCICVVNDDHVWNMIKIGDSWYHVDVTSDDRQNVSEYKSQVRHDYFLLSDDSIKGKSSYHKEWYFGEEASSTKYEGRFWSTANTALVYDSGDKIWYACNEKGIVSYSFKTGKYKLIYSFDEKWKTKSGTKKLVNPMGSVCAYEDYIYFNSGSAVYSYKPSDGTIKKIYTSSVCADGEKQIYDMYISSGKLYLGVAASYGDTLKYYRLALS